MVVAAVVVMTVVITVGVLVVLTTKALALDRLAKEPLPPNDVLVAGADPPDIEVAVVVS